MSEVSPVPEKELLVPRFQFEDARFDDPGENWVRYSLDARLDQRYVPDRERLLCETILTIRGATIEDAVQLLRGPWTWWRHGRSTHYRVNADGSTSQTLAPVWWHFTRVGIQMFPRRDLPGTGGIRLPMMMTRHFRGPASIDLYPNPLAGGIILRGRYHNVEDHVPLIPGGLATKLHLRAEAGTLLLPFPKGTGFAGLYELLETAACERQAVAR